MGVHQPYDPLLRRYPWLVESRAVDVIHVAKQAQGLDAHPPPILHQPLSTARVLHDVDCDPLYALAHVHANKLLLAGSLVRAHRTHADPQGLLGGDLMLAGEQLELDILVRARDRPPLGRGLEAKMIRHSTLRVRIPGDLLFAHDAKGKEGALVLLPTLVAEWEGDDVVPRLHDSPSTLGIQAQREADEPSGFRHVADTAISVL
mmetsp:Transcript_41954/g.110751  ORF Transcript_41954/g.110751 Transcript_41954/m.110751 type:complete len:204 (+) Transcript_41954:163-774(+)